MRGHVLKTKVSQKRLPTRNTQRAVRFFPNDTLIHKYSSVTEVAAASTPMQPPITQRNAKKKKKKCKTSFTTEAKKHTNNLEVAGYHLKLSSSFSTNREHPSFVLSCVKTLKQL